MEYDFLKIEKMDSITIMKVSAPKSLNALNSKILTEIGDFVDNLDKTTRVLIVTGDGEKAFVAGADIVEMQNLNEEQGFEFSQLGARAFRHLETLDIPVIAAAKEMIFTCKTFNAEEALRIGLINAIYEPEELMTQAMVMAQKMVANAPLALKYAKECINESYDMYADDAIELESKNFGHCFATQDQKEGMAAFLEKRKPIFNAR